jgi:regulatory protein
VPRRSSSPPAGPAPISAVNAGLRLLAVRNHSRHEIRRKLARRGYSEDDVDSAVTRLAELGYLDDRAFAEGHVRRRSASLGPLALSAELAARGVDRAAADEALSGLGADAQLAAASRLVERLAGRRPFSGYRELLDSVGPRLVRRGFSPGMARAACRAFWEGTVIGLGA